MVDTPHPIRTAQLSTIGPDQYCGGGPRGNLGCRMFFFFGETCRQIINMPVVILGIRCFQVSFGPFLTIFWSKTWTWRPIVGFPPLFGRFVGRAVANSRYFLGFLRLKIQRMQNAPPYREEKKKTNRQTEAKSHAIVTTR